MNLYKENIYIPDFTAITQGLVSRLIKDEVVVGRVIIHKLIITLLEYLASRGRALGYAGLNEINKLRTLHEEGKIILEYYSEKTRISLDEPEDIIIQEINSIVRELAAGINGIVITGNEVQYYVCKAMGIQILYTTSRGTGEMSFYKFFDDNTMSVHLKEDTIPVAKIGKPGEWKYIKLSDNIIKREEIEKMGNEIIEEARRRTDSFIEIDREGSTIVQLGQYRIVITRPPLSDGWEISIVRPIKKLKLEDYNLSTELIRRFNERAEGILIAGAPGMGKTTFAQALAEYYSRMGKVVKTIESPRDMMLPPEITQYSKHYATLGELHDILLLSRPDYTVFDEMRTDEDFKLYADLRLAGIGMVGVVHATSPIDAIQRFIGRVDLGMIPSIIDTGIFIDCGKVSKVYELRMAVKLPTGLQEADVTRPVVEVRDFMTGELEYEIYTFGEETVVAPIKKIKSRERRLKIEREIEKLLPEARINVESDKVVKVALPRNFSKEFQKRLSKLKKLERKHGFHIDVEFES